MYEYEISLIKQDLGIEKVDIRVEFVDEEYLTNVEGIVCPPGSYGTFIINLYKRKVKGISGIYVCTKNKTYQTIVQTIAHEFRHAQQYLNSNDVYIVQGYVVKERMFKGVRYSTDMPYDKRPWEQDAFQYQYDVWRRLFSEETHIWDLRGKLICGKVEFDVFSIMGKIQV